MMTCPFHAVLDRALASRDPRRRAGRPQGLSRCMPVGKAVDMGHAPDGTPLFDPRIFDTAEFQRNPYPYYRILRDHYPVFHDKFHNCYCVTRYDDITACYIDDEGFNTIPKGSRSGCSATPSSSCPASSTAAAATCTAATSWARRSTSGCRPSSGWRTR